MKSEKSRAKNLLHKGNVKVKLKLPLCLIKHHVMKVYGGVKV
jgi:hypothetical protein